MIREFLVTKMVCAKCGGNLSLSYEKPQGAGQYAYGEPTGAAMVQQIVAVEPCESCMAPVRRVQVALEVLQKGGAV